MGDGRVFFEILTDKSIVNILQGRTTRRTESNVRMDLRGISVSIWEIGLIRIRFNGEPSRKRRWTSGLIRNRFELWFSHTMMISIICGGTSYYDVPLKTKTKNFHDCSFLIYFNGEDDVFTEKFNTLYSPNFIIQLFYYDLEKFYKCLSLYPCLPSFYFNLK